MCKQPIGYAIPNAMFMLLSQDGTVFDPGYGKRWLFNVWAKSDK
jgi:hypothetical protein